MKIFTSSISKKRSIRKLWLTFGVKPVKETYFNLVVITFWLATVRTRYHRSLPAVLLSFVFSSFTTNLAAGCQLLFRFKKFLHTFTDKRDMVIKTREHFFKLFNSEKFKFRTFLSKLSNHYHETFNCNSWP